MIRKIAPHFQHRLFLTATPHNGYTGIVHVAAGAARRSTVFTQHPPDDKQLSQVMVRRLKTDLVDKDGKPLYPKRNLQALSVPFTTDERAIHKLLDSYCKSREKTCRDAGAPGTKFVNSFSRSDFSLRLLRSLRPWRSTSPRSRAAKCNQKPDAMADRILRKAILKAEEDYADDGQVEAAQAEAVEEARSAARR